MDFRQLLNSAQNNLSNTLSNTYDSSVESLIERLGLERRKDPVTQLATAAGVFGAGLAVGAVLGLVFAPKKGAELRGDINDQMNEQLEFLRHRIDTLSEKSRAQYQELLNRGSELVENAKDQVSKAKPVESAKELVGDAMDALDEEDEN